MLHASDFLALSIALAACSDASITMPDDSGTDAHEGGTDAGSDAGFDAGSLPDAGSDAGTFPAPAALGDIVISEIMPDSDVVTDDCGEWFELYNPSETETYDLRGCTVHDLSNTGMIDASVIIEPGQLLSFARYEPAPYCEEMLGITSPGFDPDYAYGPPVKLSNEGDRIGLTCSGVEIDAVDFQTWTIVKGASFNLDPDSFDAASNDDPGNWCSGTSVYNMAAGEIDRGTPGAANNDC